MIYLFLLLLRQFVEYDGMANILQKSQSCFCFCADRHKNHYSKKCSSYSGSHSALLLHALLNHRNRALVHSVPALAQSLILYAFSLLLAERTLPEQKVAVRPASCEEVSLPREDSRVDGSVVAEHAVGERALHEVPDLHRHRLYFDFAVG